MPPTFISASRWYWSIALFCLGPCLVVAVLLRRHWAGMTAFGLVRLPEALGMVLSLYVALVLLAYLLSVLCGRRRPEGSLRLHENASATAVTAAHDHDV